MLMHCFWAAARPITPRQARPPPFSGPQQNQNHPDRHAHPLLLGRSKKGLVVQKAHVPGRLLHLHLALHATPLPVHHSEVPLPVSKKDVNDYWCQRQQLLLYLPVGK